MAIVGELITFMSLSETTTIEQASDWSAEKLVAEMTTCESGQI